MFDWDDLKPFLAVARQGSTIAAARILGVDQSTVQRRLGALERGIGYPLVRRLPTGYKLTAFGESLLPEAQRMEDAALALQQRIEAFHHDLTGIVRVTCPEPLVYRMAGTGLLDRFHARYPGIDVQFVMSDKYLDLERGEADVAMRAGDTRDGPLIARRIGTSQWGIYASERYLERHGCPTRIEDLERHALIGFDDSLSRNRAAGWLREVAPRARVVARNDSILGVMRSALSGIGLAALPTALGDDEPELVRVLGPIPALARPWRLLTTHELRHTPRVAAFFDFMVEEVETLRQVLAGRGPALPSAKADATASPPSQPEAA